MNVIRSSDVYESISIVVDGKHDHRNTQTFPAQAGKAANYNNIRLREDSVDTHSKNLLSRCVTSNRAGLNDLSHIL